MGRLHGYYSEDPNFLEEDIVNEDDIYEHPKIESMQEAQALDDKKRRYDWSKLRFRYSWIYFYLFKLRKTIYDF